MKLVKALTLYENTWPHQDLKFLRVLIKNNPIGNSWSEAWKNNPEGYIPEYNWTQQRECIDRLYQLFASNEGRILMSEN